MAVTVYAWDALGGNPASSNTGVLTWTNQIPFLSFASGTTITETFIGMVPWGVLLSSSGVKVDITWNSASATTGNVNWGAAYERLGNATIASDHFGTQVTQATTVSGTVSINVTTTIAIPYANMNSAVAGEPLRLQIQRVTGASDTMAGAALLTTVHIYTP